MASDTIIKVFFMNIYFKKKFKSLKANNKGFSLISTLVASVIGLIVIFGLNKSLVHLNTQSMALQSQIKHQNLHSRVQAFFNDPDKCAKHFNSFIPQVLGSSKFQYAALRTVIGGQARSTGVDFNKSEFKKSYFLKLNGMNTFETTCNGPVTNRICNIKMYYQKDDEIMVQLISQVSLQYNSSAIWPNQLTCN